MSCKFCKTKPVFTIVENGITLCKSCFIKYFESKVLKTIRKYGLIDKTDKIGIAVSGGADSFSLLYLLNKLSKERKYFDLICISINEGARNLDNIKKFCKENSIEFNEYTFKKEFGKNLNQINNKLKKTKLKPCSAYSVLARYLLNSKARKLKLDKIATGHVLDDEVESILINMFKNDVKRSAILGPINGIVKDKRFVRRIKPFYFMKKTETELYAKLKKLKTLKKSDVLKDSYRNSVRDRIDNFESKYVGTKNSIISSFLEILPLLKEKYKGKEIKLCKKCKEPCSGKVCNACEILKIVK